MDFNTLMDILISAMGGKQAAGTVIYIFILFFVTASTCKKSLILTLLLMMPITVLFSRMELLDTDLTTLFLFTAVLGLSLTIWRAAK